MARASACIGANGEDLILKVPVGTVVRLLDEDLEPCEEIADLTHNGERVIVAKGGRGGRGNTHFVTPTRRAPSFSELGEPTDPFWIELEMKLMADAALVGMPSVGKSSLIACMSAARPKIADYPFTTLTPNLGMVRYGDLSFTVADVPGLIEGAAEGKGLGHEFLRHVERTALILHVVDLTGGLEGRDPVEDYEIIKRELELYAPELADRPVIVVGNKVDVPGTEENLERLRTHVRAESDELSERLLDEGIDIANPIPFFAVSAVTQTGIDSLIAATATEVHRLREQAAEDPMPEYDQIWEHKRLERDSVPSRSNRKNRTPGACTGVASSAWSSRPSGTMTRLSPSCNAAWNAPASSARLLRQVPMQATKCASWTSPSSSSLRAGVMMSSITSLIERARR